MLQQIVLSNVFYSTLSRPICTYFTRWLIPTNSYYLTRMIQYDSVSYRLAPGMLSFLNTHTYFPSSGVQQDSEIFSRCDLSWSSGGTTGGTSSRIIMHEDTPARCEFNSNSLYAYFYHIRVCAATKLVHVFCDQKKNETKYLLDPKRFYQLNLLDVKYLLEVCTNILNEYFNNLLTHSRLSDIGLKFHMACK